MIRKRSLNISLEDNFGSRINVIYGLFAFVMLAVTTLAFTLDRVHYPGRMVLAEFDGPWAHGFGIATLFIATYLAADILKNIKGSYIAPRWPYLISTIITLLLLSWKYS